MSNITASQAASVMYEQAKNIATGKTELEISWSTVMVIAFLGFLYMVVSSIGINIYSNCEAMKNKPVQENLNKFLAATLTIALTIPFTLLIIKLFKNEAAIFTLIYSVMGLVGSAAALNWTVKCDNAKQSEKNFAGITVAIYSISLLMSFYLLKPKGGVRSLTRQNAFKYA